MKKVICLSLGIAIFGMSNHYCAAMYNPAPDLTGKRAALMQMQNVFSEGSDERNMVENLILIINESQWTPFLEEQFDYLSQMAQVMRQSGISVSASPRPVMASPSRSAKNDRYEKLLLMQNVFPKRSDNYRNVQQLMEHLNRGAWSKVNEMEFSRLLKTDGVQLALNRNLMPARTSSLRINPAEEERLTKEKLERERMIEQSRVVARHRQEEQDALYARQLQEAERTQASAALANQNQLAGNAFSIRLPLASSALAPHFENVLGEIDKIVKSQGLDFDVHAFDVVFGSASHAFDIDAPACRVVMDYLRSAVPPERVMTLEQIYELLLQCLNDCPQDFRTQHDLSKVYLDDAFHVLKTASPHSNLIEAFRLVCTVINDNCPSMLYDILSSLLSNVNKFKGAKCYQGFRNRMFSTICIIYGRINLGMFKELFKETVVYK